MRFHSNDPGFDREELLRLIGEMLDDGEKLGGGGRERLNELLRAHPEARRLFREHTELHARLHLDYSGGLAPEAMPGESSGDRIRVPRFSRITIAMAAVLVVTLFAVVTTRLLPTAGSSDEAVIGVEGGVAVLGRSLGVEWGEKETSFREGDILVPGVFRIVSGLAQIEFFEGAGVILEGPAELEIVSASRVKLLRGRLRASVPEPARGFVVEGPAFDAVDLGTEFAVSVDSAGRGEIHVLDGEVALHEKTGARMETLTADRAARIGTGAGGLESIEGSGRDFIDRERLSKMTGRRGESRYSEWRRYRTRLIDDPDTVVYFDFEDHAPWDGQLRSARPGGPNAAIVGARWVSGRWPGKGAVEFKRAGDRIRLDIPGEFESLTLAAWVRIEGLDRRYNSLFLTDGWDRGEPHWHIGREGQLTFGIRDVGTQPSRPLLGPGDLGRWLHLAATFDAGSGVIRHYRDGEPVSVSESFTALPLRFGPSEIGNWQPKPLGETRLRSFNGRFDEFLLSRRAFSPEEIREHFEQGSPYR